LRQNRSKREGEDELRIIRGSKKRLKKYWVTTILPRQDLNDQDIFMVATILIELL
jgi:hypothetical protein